MTDFSASHPQGISDCINTRLVPAHRITMKTNPISIRQWIVFALLFVLIQPSAMYLLLRVLHWPFILSAFLATMLGVGGVVLMGIAMKRSNCR